MSENRPVPPFRQDCAFPNDCVCAARGLPGGATACAVPEIIREAMATGQDLDVALFGSPERALASISAMWDLPLQDLSPALWYPARRPGTPDLLVFRYHPLVRMAHATEHPVVNDRYFVIFVETAGDLAYVAKAMARPVGRRRDGTLDFDGGIGKPNHRRSELPFDGIYSVVMYAPAQPGWPSIVVACLPRAAPGEGYARDRYGWDAFATEQDAMDHMTMMSGRAGQALLATDAAPDPVEVPDGEFGRMARAAR